MKRRLISSLTFLTILLIGYVSHYIQPSGHSLLGIRGSIVQSDSMFGTFEGGDVIFSYLPKSPQFFSGDIVTFKTEKTIVTHRIKRIGITDTDTYFTKGDANREEDPLPVSKEQIIGKYVFRIPKVGFFAAKIQTTRGLIAVTYFSLSVMLIGNLLNEWRGKKGETVKYEK